LTKSETVLVTDKIEFERDFGTGMLPLGNYIISLDLIYPGGTAPSSAQFEVIPMNFGNLLGVIFFFLIMLILIFTIIILIVLIARKRNENNKRINS
jgi:large-conductance mechanosensitive channel